MKIFRKLYKLTSWVLPTKYQRLCYRDLCTFWDLKKEINSAHENYKKVIERIKNKKDKIKVVFLIRENSKWTYQSLYEDFAKSDRFEPLVLVSLLTLVKKDKTRNNLDENYEFFKARGMNVEYACKNGEYIDLKKFEPDIIFYDQPWELPEIHMPLAVSEFALTCYSSYSFEVVDCREDYLSDFHRFLYKFFVDSELNMNRYEGYHKGNSDNCVAIGYPKLDDYIKASADCNIWKDKDKYKIIYAPHHSFGKSSLKLATFKQNGRFILELAKSHPETTWIFKPHPRLKYALLQNKIMTEEEVNSYINEWNKVGIVYEQGDYFDFFKTSDLMITDCCSFLGEYLPSKHPVIRLVNPKAVKINSIGELINDNYYLANNNDELEKYFNMLVIEGKDSKREGRINLINKLFFDEPVAAKIYNYLSDCLK